MQSILLLFNLSTFFIFGFNALEYSNRWTVQIDGDSDEADRLARKHGFVNHGKVIDDYYSFQNNKVDKISSLPSAYVHKGLLSEPNVKMVEQQEMKSFKLLSSESVHFNDARWPEMWYINRIDGPTHNVIDVWKRSFTGKGVVVAVVDEGFDPEHPEIKANYLQNASLDVVDNDSVPVSSTNEPQYGHGEKSAGVIAAVFNNSNCGVGLAYNAKLGGIRLFFKEKASDADTARALSHATHLIDIYSNSWGPNDKGLEVEGPGYLTQRALKSGAEKGRRGLGSIYVFAAGNGGVLVKDSCAFNGYVNNIYTVAISGIKGDGSIPVFGEPCTGIIAVTYTKDIFEGSKVITADTNKACTDDFGASSAAAAMASGLIALMLSANGGLSWRDVQHIIIWTARQDVIRYRDGDWNRNKAGLRVNDYVGFGFMDASKMIDAAIRWTRVPPKVNCSIPRRGINKIIKAYKRSEVLISLTDWKNYCHGTINYLEHVEVSVNLTYTLRGELLIKLTSPQGTVSNLTHYREADAAFGAKDLNWVLMTLHHWGENATGLWKLSLESSHPEHYNTGILYDWTLILHGTAVNPLENNTHVPVLQPADKITKCEDPGKPENGWRVGNNFGNGSVVRFKCKSPSYVLVGASNIRCNEGEWSGKTPSCEDADECVYNVSRCHSNSSCKNTAPGYCCECNEGYIGNGIVCEKEGTNLRFRGRLLGNINGITLTGPLVDLIAITKDGRVYVLILNPPLGLAHSLKILTPFADAIGWSVGFKNAKGVPNGFSLIGNRFTRNVAISFDTGEVLNLYQSFTGKDPSMTFIAFESAINGTMPVISPNSIVKVNSFKEVFRRVDRGRVEANGTVTFEVDGQVHGFSVLQDISYDELDGCESGFDSFTVESSVLRSKYDEKQIDYSGVAIKSSIINASKQEDSTRKVQQNTNPSPGACLSASVC